MSHATAHAASRTDAASFVKRDRLFRRRLAASVAVAVIAPLPASAHALLTSPQPPSMSAAHPPHIARQSTVIAVAHRSCPREHYIVSALEIGRFARESLLVTQITLYGQT